jgi:hypothetical protein
MPSGSVLEGKGDEVVATGSAARSLLATCPLTARRRLHLTGSDCRPCSAPAVAGLVDQRRRERRLIQKAPADSATRTPIHPAKRSSEDRCIVSGSSIDEEGTRPTVCGRTAGASL